MSDEEFDLEDIERRMTGAIASLKQELAGLRTGRASSSLVENLQVEAYGAHMPMNQVATISVPEPRMISVQVWDKSQVAAVEKAIRESDLGLNPVTEGQLLRLPLPDLSEERRQELVKVAHKYTEQAKVAVRNVRRDGMDQLKKAEKAGEMSEDEHHAWADEVQEQTDKAVKQLDELLSAKEADILTV